LIVGIDVPDDALDENLVLVHGNQSTENEWRHFGENNRVGGTIAFENFVRKNSAQLFLAHSGLEQLLFSFFGTFALHQSLSLSQEIGHQQLVMKTSGNRMQSSEMIARFLTRYSLKIASVIEMDVLGRSDKISRNQFGALVNELIKGVLAVCSRFSPDDRSGGIFHTASTSGHIFSVGFHVSLLEISRESVHILIVGQECVRLSTEEISVPNTQNSQNDWDLKNIKGLFLTFVFKYEYNF
jgi:hypothetical protein